jgi:hypothetical protein
MPGVRIHAFQGGVPLVWLPVWAQAPAPNPPPTPTPAPPPDPAREADAAESRELLAVVKRRFGARLDEAQLEAIRADLEDNVRAGRTLRGVALQNADEPAVVFHPLPVEA